jgi:hypothetical protein
VTGAIVAALMVLRKQGKTRIAVIEPYYTYHARQVEEVFQRLPEGIPSHPDWSPDFDGISSSLSCACACACVCVCGMKLCHKCTCADELGTLFQRSRRL